MNKIIMIIIFLICFSCKSVNSINIKEVEKERVNFETDLSNEYKEEMSNKIR